MLQRSFKIGLAAFARGDLELENSPAHLVKGRNDMAKKSGRIIVTLECTEAKAAGKPVSRYTTTKNKTKTPGRMEKKKYNPNMQKHTVHRETK